MVLLMSDGIVSIENKLLWIICFATYNAWCIFDFSKNEQDLGEKNTDISAYFFNPETF